VRINDEKVVGDMHLIKSWWLRIKIIFVENFFNACKWKFISRLPIFATLSVETVKITRGKLENITVLTLSQ